MIPYVYDQLAMARLPRATYALFVALLPATATVIGVIVLHQLPSLVELAGIGLVMVGVALHREEIDARTPRVRKPYLLGMLRARCANRSSPATPS